MTASEAIMAFSQSEKIKTGLIWITQAVEMSLTLDGAEKQGMERAVRIWITLLETEVSLARRLAPEDAWPRIAKHVDTARVMLDSGVVQEVSYHLTNALRETTGIGHRSMTLLKSQELL